MIIQSAENSVMAGRKDVRARSKFLSLSLLFLLIFVSGLAQANVTRTINVGGGSFILEIEDLPTQLVLSGINNRPLQRISEIRGSIHYSNQQQSTRLAENRNRQISELDRIEVEVTATPVSGVIRNQSQATTTPYYYYNVLERSEKAPITLTDSNQFVCTRLGNETIRVQIELSGYQVTAHPVPGALSAYIVSGLYFTPVNHVETIDMVVPCIDPEDHLGAVKRAWRLQGDDIALWSEIELVLIPPGTVNVGEPINMIGLVRYKSQTAGTSLGFGSSFRASTIDRIAVGGHVRLVPRSSTSLLNPVVTPVRERVFNATALTRVGEAQAIDSQPYLCASPGRATLRWEIDETTVFAHDNATPNVSFGVPNIRQMSIDTTVECVFNPSNQISKTVYANGALLDVVVNRQDQIVDGRQQIQVSGILTYRSQAPRTQLESMGVQGAISIDNQVVALNASHNIQNTFTCPGTGRYIHYLNFNIGSVRKTAWYPDGSSDSAVMTSPTPLVAVPVTCLDRKFWGRVTASTHGPDIPVPNMKIRMVLDGRTHYTNTDRDGYFDFLGSRTALTYNDSDQVTLRFLFADGDGANPQKFRFVDNAASDTAYIETTAFPVTSFSSHYLIGMGPPWAATNIPQANANDQIKLRHYATGFALYSRATQFANREMGVSFVSPAPLGALVVSVFDAGISVSHYNSADNRIRLEVEDSSPHDHWEAASVMMHELGHAVQWHSQIGGRRDFPDPYHTRKETSHLGRANLSTTNSWIEGFANWFSALALHRYRPPLWDTRPYRAGAYHYSATARQQLNYDFKTFQWQGRSEEWAVAGTLWDVLDSHAFYDPLRDGDGNTDLVTVPLWRLWTTLNQPVMRDFKDVYDALAGLAPHYDGWQAKLDDIFKEHHFFVDADGDTRFDAGEVIGRSAWGGSSFFALYDVNKDGDFGDHWPDALPPGTTAAIPQLRTAGGDIVAAAAGAGGRRTSSDTNMADVGLQDENGDASNLELRERFMVHPHLNRRSTEIPSDLYLQYAIEDRDGNAVPEADLRVHYEFDPPKDWQNDQLTGRVPGQGSLPLLVPPEGRLRIEMFAGSYLSNELMFDEQTVEANSIQNGNQGSALFTIPATAGEIVQALAATSPPGTPPGSGSGGTTPGTGTTPTPGTGGSTSGSGGGLSSVAVVFIVIALLLIGWLVIRRP